MQEKDIEISLVDKENLILVKAPYILLVDGIVLKVIENLEIVDSVCFGDLKPIYAVTGDKIKSGTEIKSGSAIVKVESTIENSMLL